MSASLRCMLCCCDDSRSIEVLDAIVLDRSVADEKGRVRRRGMPVHTSARHPVKVKKLWVLWRWMVTRAKKRPRLTRDLDAFEDALLHFSGKRRHLA